MFRRFRLRSAADNRSCLRFPNCLEHDDQHWDQSEQTLEPSRPPRNKSSDPGQDKCCLLQEDAGFGDALLTRETPRQHCENLFPPEPKVTNRFF